MVGYRAVVIVDAIQTGRVPPGTAHELDAAELRQFTGRTPHFLGVGETLALGRRLGLPMPDLVKILAIEVEDPFTLGTELTPTLRQAIPGLVDRLSRLVNSVAAVHRVAVVQTQFFAAERRNSARVDSI
jgi:hydrogenase maturation protease